MSHPEDVAGFVIEGDDLTFERGFREIFLFCGQV
jgi:hypothetical protein